MKFMEIIVTILIIMMAFLIFFLSNQADFDRQVMTNIIDNKCVNRF